MIISYFDLCFGDLVTQDACHYYTMFSEKVNKKGARAFTLAPKMH